MPQDRRPLILLPLAAFIAITPLIFHGCSCGHDFDFHLINWFEAARQLAHATFPRWANTPAWNAGEPRFVFYPPLSWLLGALLGLLMPWTWTPIAFTWVVLTGAGLSLYYAARNFASPDAALVAAVLYLTNPYILYTAYERTAYAELMAAIWIPLALSAVLRSRVTVPSVAIPIALLWLTNAPAAVMGCYAMAVIVLIRLVLPGDARRLPLALNAAAGALLGLGLASFYLLPAAYERRFVQINMAILPGLRPWDNFLFQHTADPEHDVVLRVASMVAILLITLTALTFTWIFLGAPQSRTPPSSKPAAVTSRLGPILGILSLAIFFMLTPLSAPLWRYLPELRFLQFPWRFLAVLGAVFGFALTLALSRFRLRGSVAALLCAAAFALPGYRVFHQYCYPEDTVAERLTVFRSADPGTDPTDEYTPVPADNDFHNHQNPGYWLAEKPDVTAPESATPGPAPRQLNLSPSEPTNLVLNLRNYPAWTVTRNGSPVSTRLARKDGLIAIPLPAGPSHLEITYATLRDQKLGYLVSVLSGAILGSLILRERRRTRSL